MNISLEEKKLRLIQLIMSITDDQALNALEKEAVKIKAEAESVPDVNDAIRPLRSNLSLEEIAKTQGYQPVTYQQFREDADQLKLEEPIEELLAMLTK